MINICFSNDSIGINVKSLGNKEKLDIMDYIKKSINLANIKSI